MNLYQKHECYFLGEQLRKEKKIWNIIIKNLVDIELNHILM